VLADPAPQVLLTAFAESGINLDLGFWIADPQEGTGGVRSAINMAIWRSFARASHRDSVPAARSPPDRRYAVSGLTLRAGGIAIPWTKKSRAGDARD
jgi:hypothetical protein